MEGFLFNEQFLEDNDLSINDISMLEEEAKVEKTVKNVKNKVDNSKVKAVVDEGKAIVKMIYSMKDEDFVEGKIFPNLSRLFVRATAIYGLWLINPLVGIIGFITDKTIKRNMDVKQRKRLRTYYQNKLEFLEDRIGRVEDEKEKYKLIKLKATLKSNIRRVDATLSNMK